MFNLTLEVREVTVLSGNGMDRIRIKTPKYGPFSASLARGGLCLEFNTPQFTGARYVNEILGVPVDIIKEINLCDR